MTMPTNADRSQPNRPSLTQSAPIKWPLASRVFHWVSVLLLIITWLMMVMHNNSETNQFMALHKAFGVSLLCWMIARLLNRLLMPSPRPVTMPKWQSLLAHLTHAILYILLIAMPVAGLLMTVFGGRTVSMFGLFTIPVFVDPDRGLARLFNDIHVDIIWPLIIVFTLLHIGAALYHHFIKKDGLIRRMK